MQGIFFARLLQLSVAANLYAAQKQISFGEQLI
jgi:hypothetical protein